MNGESSSPTLTERGFKWFFRTSPHDGHFSLAMFEFIKEFEKKKSLKFKTVGIMHEDTLFGVDSAKTQDDLAKKYGYEVLVNMAYRAKTTSLDAEVGKLKSANPDVFLPHLLHLGRRALRQDGQDPRLHSQDAHRPERGLGRSRLRPGDEERDRRAHHALAFRPRPPGQEAAHPPGQRALQEAEGQSGRA
jgi:hypothetical protein